MEQKVNTPPISFSFCLPVNLVFGSGKVDLVGELSKPYGSKALIVTGGSSAKKSGLYDRVKENLAAQHIDSVLFDEVTPNPLTTTALAGSALAKESGCDMVVAIGGGSILDCAKAIAFFAVNDGDINDYIFNRLQSSNALPMIAIPTTCGTGSEGNGFSVLTNPETGDKKSLRSNAIIPKVSIIDPTCMMTMPKSVLASVGFDALCHCMEAYTASIAQPLSDAWCLYGISLLAENLVPVYQGKIGLEGYEKITLASTIGGMCINIGGVTLPHAMEHPVSGLKDIVHGHGLAALTPSILDLSWKYNEEKYSQISRLLGGESAKDCAEKIRQLLRELNMVVTLGDLGIEESDVAWLAENCLKVSGVSVANHPIVLTQTQLEEVYCNAL